MMKKFLTIVSAALTLGVSQAEVQTGSEAPEFELTSVDGKSVSLKSYKGKTIVLEWHNPGCPFVKKFYTPGKMQELQEATVAGGGVWLTINSSADGKPGSHTSEEMAKILADQKFAGTEYLFDRDGLVGKTYGAKTTPHIYIIDKEGNVVYQGAIDSKKSTKSKDIAGATNYVETTLKALSEGKDITPSQTPAYGCGVKY